MKSLVKKFNELKYKMEYFDIFQKDDEVGLALIDLEEEIKALREIEIYKEDFSELSWSNITKNQEINNFIAYTKID